MENRDGILHNIWPKIKGRHETELAKLGQDAKDTTAIYNVQMETNLVFDYAFQRRDISLLDQLAALYMIPFNYLKEFDDYWFYKGGSDPYILLPLPGPSRMWVSYPNLKTPQTASAASAADADAEIVETTEIPEILETTETAEGPMESILNSSQFLYLIAHAVNSFVALPQSDLTPNMSKFIKSYTPVILDHLQRWIFADNGSTDLSDSIGVFHTKGWGCSNGRFNHRDFLEKKLLKEFGNLKPLSYCNAVRDLDMWIIAAAVEILAAQKKNPGLFPLDARQEKSYHDYFSIACRLLKDRLEQTSLNDFSGRPTSGYNLDPGVWTGYPDMRYAGYTGPVFPEDNSNPKKIKMIIDPRDYPVPDSISFDISHARRLVHVFETLHQNRIITRQQFPTRDILTGLANQAAYAIFNKDFKKPLFANYFDGSNGWFRVNYSGRCKFGYGPWDNSLNWTACGFGAWQKYQPDLAKVNEAVWTMIKSTDPDTREFRKMHYEQPYYSNGARVLTPGCFALGTSCFIINFIAACDLPVTVEKKPNLSLNRTNLNFGAMEGSEIPTYQDIIVANTGEKTLAWTASAGNAVWLACSPTSGIDSGVVTVSSDPGQLQARTYQEKIVLSDPDAGNSPQNVTVTLEVYRLPQDVIPIGALETPKEGETVSGSVAVTGWALDKIEVERVRLYRGALPTEGSGLLFLGDALFVEDVRPDIVKAYPGYPFNYRAGWGYMLLTNALPNNGNGTFTLHVKIKNTTGREVLLGTRTIICDNAHAALPFGTIDTPAPGAVASGKKYRIQGWVLTPQPNKIPGNGSTIKVYVDDKPIDGKAVYGIPRPDIAQLFPGYANSAKAHAYFELDTTKYKNGVHSLSWVVADNADNTAGIGSRFFVIKN